LFISSPESIKKGMANNAKLSKPVAIRCDTVVNDAIESMDTIMVNNDDTVILQATGVPIARRNKKLRMSTRTGV